jgi:hypothetical protein
MPERIVFRAFNNAPRAPRSRIDESGKKPLHCAAKSSSVITRRKELQRTTSPPTWRVLVGALRMRRSDCKSLQIESDLTRRADRGFLHSALHWPTLATLLGSASADTTRAQLRVRRGHLRRLPFANV